MPSAIYMLPTCAARLHVLESSLILSRGAGERAKTHRILQCLRVLKTTSPKPQFASVRHAELIFLQQQCRYTFYFACAALPESKADTKGPSTARDAGLRGVRYRETGHGACVCVCACAGVAWPRNSRQSKEPGKTAPHQESSPEGCWGGHGSWNCLLFRYVHCIVAKFVGVQICVTSPIKTLY